MIAKSHQGQLTALAVAAVLSLWVAPAVALSLGRVTVQSALGEPLRAEIDLLDINAEEAASLQARVAQPDAFKAAGLDYNAALGNLRATLLRRPDGRAYLGLTSDRVVNDPFVDMILETSWSSGRIVRDYTLLFDPPHLRAPVAPVVAQVPVPAPVQAANLPPAAAPTQATPRVTPAAPTTPRAVAAKTAPQPTGQAAQPPASDSSATVTVKPGDTAGRIAANNKPANVSLDQMLVAMLRNNPDAFIQDNVNRIKAGAVLTLPSAAQSQQVAPEQATQIIVAQSQNFNDFRQKFAGNVPTTKAAPASRDVSGKVDATVKDKKPASATPDKLTLSKGVVAGSSAEDKLAQARNQQEAAARAAELAKNISDLSKLQAAASSPADQGKAPGSAIPVVPPASSASKPRPTVVVPVKPASALTPVKSTAPEPGLIDNLLENPLLPIGSAALLALLAALGIYKVRQRKQAALADQLPDAGLSEPFSGASGGQNVDTHDSLTTGTSMVYTPSQLDAVDDVDPVAEADVYLAYGRDLQAEEILKDALRTDPQRLAIHLKLLDIYAKRPDAKAFESIATLAFNLTDGSGSQWEQVCEKGISIDPDNALYLPGGQPQGAQQSIKSAKAASPTEQATVSFSSESTQIFAAPVSSTTELDLDLDFSSEEFSAAAPASPVAAIAATVDQPEPSLPDLPELSLPTPVEMTAEEPATPALSPNALSLDAIAELPAVAAEEGFNLTAPLPMLEPHTEASEPTVSLSLESHSAAPVTPEPAQNNDMMDFDLGSLSLDLNDDLTGSVTGDTGLNGDMDPLETKLALADEFRAIGDDDGARALIEEVLAEATGDLKIKAQNALNKL